MLELIQYAPQTEQVRRTPLLIVPPTINKNYALDLAPGRSLVEYLVRQGQQVFMISWRNPDARHADWGLDAYVAAVLEAMDAVERVSRRGEHRPRRRVLRRHHRQPGRGAPGRDRQAAPVGRVHPAGDGAGQRPGRHLGGAGRRAVAAAAKAMSRRRGYLDGRALAEVFAWLRPGDLIWNYWVNNYLLGKQPPAFDILFWNSDTTRMTAGLHADFIDIAVGNALVTPGAVSASGPRSTFRRSGRLLCGRRDRRPHHPLAELLPQRPAAGRRHPLRAVHQRPHRGPGQPARPTPRRPSRPTRTPPATRRTG